MPIKYLSVCSGMEAASVAWHPLGWEPVGFSEIEPFPCEILKQRFPNTPNYGDLTKYPEWPIQPGTVDVLVGGTPCQSFSVAGLRKGLEDPRGNLALVFLGLADRIKPKWIIWENVPGVLSSNGGRDFGSFLGALGQLGYGFAYRVLDAQFFGVPQRRRRVFVVASLGGWRSCAEVLSIAEGVRGNLEAGGKKRKGVATDAGSGVEAEGLPRTVGTLCADTHPGAYSGQDAYTGRLIPSIIQISELRLKGQISEQNICPTLLANSKSGDNEPIVIDRAAFNQGENAQYEPHIEQTNKMDTIVSRGPHAIAFTPGNLVRQAGPNPSTETFPTLSKDSGDQNPHVALKMAVRRLTPIECERLQGFPDNWSRISWKGKAPEECPDGPRYKACGNSMAVPVMRWIGERIQAQS